MNYIIVTWPESQKLMDATDFMDHSYLICDDVGIERFGSGAYFVEKDWYDEICGCKSSLC